VLALWQKTLAMHGAVDDGQAPEASETTGKKAEGTREAEANHEAAEAKGDGGAVDDGPGVQLRLRRPWLLRRQRLLLRWG